MITLKLISTTSVISATLLLSGCDTVATRVAGFTDAAVALQAAFDEDLGETTMPDSGEATYSGNAMLVAAQGETTADAFAGASMFSADFGTGKVSGELSDFVVLEGLTEADEDRVGLLLQLGLNEDATEAEQRAALEAAFEGAIKANGTIAVGESDIVGTDFMPTFEGSLTHNGTTTTVGGSGLGAFGGPDALGVQVQGETDDSMTVTQNGEDRDGLLRAVGLKD